MSSRKKADGVSAVQMIEAAAAKKGYSIKDLFRKAGVKSSQIGEVFRKFELLRSKGPVGAPGFKIPPNVIKFAESA